MKTSFRRPETLVLLINAITILAVMVFFLVELMSGRSEALKQAERDLQHFTSMLSGHTERSLSAVDILINEISLDLSHHRRDWQSWDEKHGWEYISRRHTRALPQVRDLMVFDHTGRQHFVSTKFPTPAVNISDRPYFKTLQDGSETATFGPYIGRNTGRYTFALTRRITREEGKFGGVIGAAIENAYFHDYCWPNRLHDHIDAYLINKEGKVVASCRPADLSPQSPVIGQPVSKAFGVVDFNINPGKMRSAGRMFAVSALTNFPDLLVVSSLPESAALTEWRHNAAAFAAFALIIVSILLSVGWLLRRQVKTLASTSAELHYHRQHLEESIQAATAALAAEKEEAERANIAKSRFLAAASHDLRQPLHALSLFTSDLQRQIRSGQTRDLDQLAGQINLSVHSLKDVFDSLLDISRLDMGRIEPEIHPFRLQEVFERVHLVFRRAALSRRVVLRIRPTAYWINSDDGLVERLLSNLVSNAIRYSHTGGHIMVAARHRQNGIRIEVRDNGPGIAPEDQAMVFREFVQLGNPERNPEKGLGLGLPIVQRLVQTLGGKLELNSRPGAGTTFAVTLPAAKPGALDSGKGQRQAILVLLSDCPELAKIAQLAGAWGYRCKLENDPESMVIARGDPPHIVFAGVEQASQLRSLLAPECPVVVVSEGRVIAGEGVHVLKTPIRPARLRALLEQLQKTLPKSIR